MDVKRQTVVATSTAEAEYIALYHCAQEAVVMRELLSELDGAYRDKPLVIMCDSQSAIAISKNNSRKSRAKHIDIKYHFVREAVENGIIALSYCSTTEMVADPLTKPLSRDSFVKFREKLGLQV